MARDFAKAFYSSSDWLKCRAAYLQSVGGLCEECLKQGLYTPAVVVHHKIHLSPDNIRDPGVSLNFANLQAVCTDCHAKLHSAGKRYKIAPDGRVITSR